MNPSSRPETNKGRRLAAEARQAAEVRDALTHPDVVALRVEKVRSLVDRFIWVGMILGLLFTMTNVQRFVAHTIDAESGSLGWWAAWLLDPTVSVILLGVLIAERETSRWQIPAGQWARAAKWSLLASTYVMNTWQSYAAGSVAGIVLHSVPPLAVFMAAEAVTDCNDKLTEAVHRALAHATERAERQARTEQQRPNHEQQRPGGGLTTSLPGPVPPAPVPPPPVSAVWAAPAVRPADRSAGRTEPSIRTPAPERGTEQPVAGRPDRHRAPIRPRATRPRTGKPRTDAQLVVAVRELAEQTGTTPSQYQVKQRFGVGSARAARLLADLDNTPAGAPASNGAATRTEGGSR